MSDNTFNGIMCGIIYVTIYGMIALATNWAFPIFLFLVLTTILFWMT